MAQYELPKELKAKNKAWKWLYVFDLFFVVAWMGVCLMAAPLVDVRLEIPFYIFNLILAIIFTAPSPVNAQKRIFQSVYYLVRRDKATYIPLKGRKQKNEIHYIKEDN